MAATLFSREVSVQMEQVGNPFSICRALFNRARDLNSQPKSEDDTTFHATALAFADYAEGRIVQVDGGEEEEEEEK